MKYLVIWNKNHEPAIFCPDMNRDEALKYIQETYPEKEFWQKLKPEKLRSMTMYFQMKWWGRFKECEEEDTGAIETTHIYPKYWSL